MNITLHPALSLNEQGKRENNEDSIYPGLSDRNPVEGLFMVCDGVGGNEKGEVASRLACHAFAKYIAQNKSTKYGLSYFSDALHYVESDFDAYISETPQAKGMATTLTLAYFNPNGVSLVHIGDSRIYHLRCETILWQTKDHSFVNALVATGAITKEEAREHPKRNVILRAITGTSTKPTKPDIYECTSVEAGDYFFLCSDGILESISNEDLMDIVFSNETEQEKMENIRHRCNKSSDDNFSCILIKVKSVELTKEELLAKKEITKPIVAPPEDMDTQSMPSDNPPLGGMDFQSMPNPNSATTDPSPCKDLQSSVAEIAGADFQSSPRSANNKSAPPRNSRKKWIILIALLIAISLSLFFYKRSKSSSFNDKPKTESIPTQAKTL